MPEPEGAPAAPAREQDRTPLCKRCGERDWDVERLPKSRARWIFEIIFAAPDVWIFQGESGGWPGKEYERWTCRGCGRRAKVS